MDEGSRLKSLARILPGHLGGRQLQQLVIDEGQKLLSGPSVALLDGVQDSRDIGHRNGSPLACGGIIGEPARVLKPAESDMLRPSFYH